MDSKFRIETLVLIFLLALSARVLYLEQIKQNLIFFCPIADSGDYNLAAKNMSETDMSKYRTDIGRIPLYRYFLAFIYKLGGYDIYLSSFMQAIIGAFCCSLIYLLAVEIFSPRVGVISGIAASLYWPFIAFNAKTLPVNLAIFFSLLSAISIYRFLAERNMLWIIASSVFLALSSIARPNILLVLPVLSIWFFFHLYKKCGRAKSILYSSIFITSFLSIMALFIMMDYNVRSRIIPVHERFGIGVYVGSNLDYTARPGYRWEKLRNGLSGEELLTSKERDLYWLNKTKELITKRPIDYIKNIHKKLYILWNYYEFSPNECINYFRLQSKFLSLPLLDFGFIAAFSIVGMLLAWRNFKNRALPVYLFIFAYQISILPFTPMARFRLPMAPFLILFASYGLSELVGWFRLNQRRNIMQFIILFTPLYILTNSTFFNVYLRSFERPYYHRGIMSLRYIDDGKYALDELKKALRKDPNDADIYQAIGDAYTKLGNALAAERSYKKASEIKSRYRAPWEN